MDRTLSMAMRAKNDTKWPKKSSKNELFFESPGSPGYPQWVPHGGLHPIYHVSRGQGQKTWIEPLVWPYLAKLTQKGPKGAPKRAIF